MKKLFILSFAFLGLIYSCSPDNRIDNNVESQNGRLDDNIESSANRDIAGECECENFSYEASYCPSTASGCCSVALTFKNTATTCKFVLKGTQNLKPIKIVVPNGVPNVPAYEQANLTVCPKSPIKLTVESENGSKVCAPIKLNALNCLNEPINCNNANFTVDYQYEKDIDGCCFYDFTFYNDDPNPMFIFDSANNILFRVPPFSTIKNKIKVCSAEETFRIGTANKWCQEICDSVTLYCN